MNSFSYIFYVFVLLSIVFKKSYCGFENSSLTLLDEQVQIPCTDNTLCEELGLMECKNGVCQLNNNLTKVKIASKVLKLGQNCSQAIHCNIENSLCNEKGKCVCTEQYIGSVNYRKCLKVLKSIDLPCEETHQCMIPESICQDNKCQCRSNTHFYNGKCYENVELGGACKVNEDCLNTNFGICRDNICTCDTGYVQSTRKTSTCLIKANRISSNCMENVQCISSLGYGSMCSDDGTCQCLEFHHFIQDENKCIINTLLGDSCGIHEDCHQPGNDHNHLECVLGVCKCKSSYYDYKGYYCLLNSSKRWTTFDILNVFFCAISYLTFYIIIH